MNYSAPQAPNFFSALVSAFVKNVFCHPKNKRARRRRRIFFSLSAGLSHDFLLSSKTNKSAPQAPKFFSLGVRLCHDFLLSSPQRKEMARRRRRIIFKQWCLRLSWIYFVLPKIKERAAGAEKAVDLCAPRGTQTGNIMISSFSEGAVDPSAPGDTQTGKKNRIAKLEKKLFRETGKKIVSRNWKKSYRKT